MSKRRDRDSSQHTDHRKTRLKKDDEVIVIAGKEKGKRGKIMNIDTNSSKVLIQGVNKIKRFQRPSQENPQGGELELEYPLHISNVMLFDSKTKKGTRTGVNKDSAGKKKRVTRSAAGSREI